MTAEFEDPYNLRELRTTLTSIGYRLHFRSQVRSTMPIIDKYARSGDNQLRVALTNHQTYGQGSKMNRPWHDIYGCSLLFSALIKGDQDALSPLPDLIALRTCLAIRGVSGIQEVQLKWPNDFVIEGKKVGGMMVPPIFDLHSGSDEPVYRGSNLGLGLNVHYSEDDISQMQLVTDYGVTSLDIYTPKPNSLQNIFIEIMRAIRYTSLEATWVGKNKQATQDLNNLWRKLSALVNRVVRIDFEQERPIQGKVIDTQIGEGILVETHDGKSEWYVADGLTKLRMLN